MGGKQSRESDKEDDKFLFDIKTEDIDPEDFDKVFGSDSQTDDLLGEEKQQTFDVSGIKTDDLLGEQDFNIAFSGEINRIMTQRLESNKHKEESIKCIEIGIKLLTKSSYKIDAMYTSSVTDNMNDTAVVIFGDNDVGYVNGEKIPNGAFLVFNSDDAVTVKGKHILCFTRDDVSSDLTEVYSDISNRLQLVDKILTEMKGVKKIHGDVCIEGPKAELLKKVQIERLLGSGSFGMVYKACAPKPCDEKSYRFAVKLASMTKAQFRNPYDYDQSMWREVIILRDIIKPIVVDKFCPNLPVVSDIYSCDSCSFELHGVKSKKPCAVILTELATQGSLSDWLDENQPEDHVYSCIFQVMAGMNALQARAQIINTDIKKENILCYRVTPGGYWKYIVNGIPYYVPNYGTLFVINDFGVAKNFDPSFVFTNMKKDVAMSLGLRFAMIINGEYSPLYARENPVIMRGKMAKEKLINIAWGPENKTGQRFHTWCSSIDVEAESYGGHAWITKKTKKIVDSNIEFTPEQAQALESMGIPANSNDPNFYRYPSIIPPLDMRWDTQDAIRMFTGGNRTYQQGKHCRPPSVNDKIYNEMRRYIFNPVANGTTRLIPCSEQTTSKVVYSKTPDVDLAGYFINSFFKNWTSEQEDVTATYQVS